MIQAFVSFDGQYPTVRSLLYTDATGEHVDMPAFRIPADAKEMRVWFSGGPSRYANRNRVVYDSDFGNNFYRKLV